MKTKLTKSWHGLSKNTNTYVPQPTQTQQGGPYAPPPGPPPQWSQWQTPSPSQTNGRQTTTRRAAGSASRTHIASREEEIRRLFRACETGKGNAQLLHEALVYAKPKDLKENDLIEEFRAKCRVSQELICSTIPWTTAEVDRAKSTSSGGGETQEERLLSEMLVANQELLEALQMYDDLARVGTEQEERDRKKAERKLRALDAITSFEPTSSETTLVDQIFTVGDPLGGGSISSHAAYKLFTGTGLPSDVLAEIWGIANVEENDMFGRHCIGVALRLVGYAQHGKTVTEDLVNQGGPLAFIDGFDPLRQEASHSGAGPSSSSYSSSAGAGPSSSISLASPSSPILPPLTSQDREKFVKIFYNSGPENGVLSAQRARDVLLKSKLPLSILGQIWELADTQQRGVLDLPSFCIAMYLVQGCMSGQIASMPPSLPPFLYAEAAQAAPGLSPQIPIATASRSQSSLTAGSAIPPDVRASADAFFDALDEEKKGYLDGEAARSHFSQSGLPQDALWQVWRLADVNADGRLTRDEFAVALYLIQSRESGQELPQTLPANLIPSASRSSSGSQTPQFPQPSVQQEDLLIDLDVPEESVQMPMPSVTIPTPPQVTPPVPSPVTPASSAVFRSPTISAAPPLPLRSPLSVSTSPSAAPPLPPRSPTISSIGRQPSSPNLASPQPPPITSTEWIWEIAPADRAGSDKFFDQLDPWKQGSIEGDAAVAFLSKSKLPRDILARVWDLADRDHDGRLDKNEFAVVMYLVRGRLEGRALPESVPPSFFEPPRPSLPPETGSLGGSSAQQSVAASPVVAASAPTVFEDPHSDEPPPPYQENIPADV